MPITTRCPECGAKYRLAREHIGRQAKCKNGHVFTVVPEAQLVPEPQPVAPKAAAVQEVDRPSHPPKKNSWLVGAVGAVVTAVVLRAACTACLPEDKPSAPVRVQPTPYGQPQVEYVPIPVPVPAQPQYDPGRLSPNWDRAGQSTCKWCGRVYAGIGSIFGYCSRKCYEEAN